MRLVRTACVLCLAAASACGGSRAAVVTPTPANRGTEVTSEVGGGVIANVNTVDEVFTKRAGVDAARAFAVMPGVMEALGLTVTTIDRSTMTVRGQVLRSRRNFGGRSFGTDLRCGESLTGSNADSYAITMTVTSKITATAAGASDIATVVTTERPVGQMVAPPCLSRFEGRCLRLLGLLGVDRGPHGFGYCARAHPLERDADL